MYAKDETKIDTVIRDDAGFGFCRVFHFENREHERLVKEIQLIPEMVQMLEDLLHQLSTDSDLEDKVSRPDKYFALTTDLRELVERVTGRRTTC